MTTLVLEAEPVINNVAFADEKLIVELTDGRSLSVPLTWYPRLLVATPPERVHWHLLGEGYGIEWPDLDEHISVEGLLAGRRSGESQHSFQRWLAARKS
ncbi:MAG: DUF2442 domain-containing protein [Caldilineaceae bacterium]|nr:DUF2442 domain-containing protein [Caldilineaceae bacterium]